MPHRSIAAREFGTWLGVLAHPDRLRLVEELSDTERDVTDLSQALGLPHARTSSQLAALRSHRLVDERRHSRRVFYRLTQPELATWLLAGMRLMENSPHVSENLREMTRQAREKWSHD
jgi:DNA-binding transcriptional ArsR family regulator